MSQATKGPWEAARPDDLDVDGAGVFAKNKAGLSFYVAKATNLGTADPEPMLANARLIAAAPDMLDALKRMLAVYEALMPGLRHIAVRDYAEINDAPLAARKAIAKAEAKS